MQNTSIIDNFFEQMNMINKAQGFDILKEQVKGLQEENSKLRSRVKYLEQLIDEYTLRMKANLSGGKVDEFLKGFSNDNRDDLPEGTFQSPNLK